MILATEFDLHGEVALAIMAYFTWAAFHGGATPLLDGTVDRWLTVQRPDDPGISRALVKLRSMLARYVGNAKGDSRENGSTYRVWSFQRLRARSAAAWRSSACSLASSRSSQSRWVGLLLKQDHGFVDLRSMVPTQFRAWAAIELEPARLQHGEPERPTGHPLDVGRYHFPTRSMAVAELWDLVART